jgi:hypothetical protein
LKVTYTGDAVADQRRGVQHDDPAGEENQQRIEWRPYFYVLFAFVVFAFRDR